MMGGMQQRVMATDSRGEIFSMEVKLQAEAKEESSNQARKNTTYMLYTVIQDNQAKKKEQITYCDKP